MSFFSIILLVLLVPVCLLLIGVVLLQRSKSDGMGLAFGAGMGEAIFGSRAGNVLTRITVYLASAFLVLVCLIGYVLAGGSPGNKSIMEERHGSGGAAPAPVQPAGAGPAQPALPGVSEAQQALPAPTAPMTPPATMPPGGALPAPALPGPEAATPPAAVPAAPAAAPATPPAAPATPAATP